MNLKKVLDEKKISSANLGNKIQGLMNAHKVSLAKVASATGLTPEAIRQIVNGNIKNPGIETLARIAEAFSISLYDLLETKDIANEIHKLTVKIVSLSDLHRLKSQEDLSSLMEKSIESINVLHVNSCQFDENFFAIKINTELADKLTISGMPMLKKNDFLIFSKSGDIKTSSIIIAQSESTLYIGIVMEVENDTIWIKSIDIPHKQIVVKINKENIIGAIHNVQFSR